MKITITGENGVTRQVTPEKLLINGTPLVDHINQLNEVQRKLNEIEKLYARDVEDMKALWSKIKIY